MEKSRSDLIAATEAIRLRCQTFAGFVKEAWHVLEPGTELKWSWHLQVMCLPGETLIETEAGPMRIDAIVNGEWQGRVLSFNDVTRALEWRKIVCHMRSPKAYLFAFTTASGLKFKATGNHPVYVEGRGYVPAEHVQVGDRIVEMRSLSDRVQAEGREPGAVLLPEVLRRLEGQAGGSPLSDVRRRQGLGREAVSGLPGARHAEGKDLPVRQLLEAGLQVAGRDRRHDAGDGRVLQSGLPRGLCERPEQSGLCGRGQALLLRERLPEGEEGGSGAGRPGLLPVRRDREAGRASHQPGSPEQRPSEPRDALPAMPCDPAPAAAGRRLEAVGGTITAIEREVQLSEPLFNLEVEGNHNYFANGVLLHNCDHLQAVSEGRISPWGIINVSPGSSKSTIVTVMWQAWEWGPFKKPATRFLTSSFEEENVKRDTRKTRDLILSEWYRTLWPEVLEENGKLVRAGETSFANRHTGTREGVAFVSITGKRGDRVIIDDPHSLKGAESEKDREGNVRLFMEGGLNRLNDQTKSSIIIVMQRLHEKDLTGALLAAKLGFWHLVIPMEYDPERADPESKLYVPPTPLGWTDPRTVAGELMDPVRMPRPAVEKLKGVSHYAWIGQYQQRPAAREGGLFKRSWFKRVRAVPGGVNARGRYWDLAASTEETSPYTAGALVSELDGNFYVEDVVRERLSAAGVRALIQSTAEADARLSGPMIRIRLPQDPGQAGKDQAQGFVKMLVGFDARTKPVSGDKVTRATPASAQAEAGNVFLVETGDPVADAWIEPFLEELAGFPSFAYKDQVDAFADAINDLALAPRAVTIIGRTAFGAR